MADFRPRQIRGYELRERIGAGGFGAVYRAYQSVVDREVAIKVILAQYANQTEFIRRFEIEAQIVARLEHPFIVPLYDYWRDPDGAYLVMRFLRGGSLRHLSTQGAIPIEKVAGMLDQIAAALSAAHLRGIIHRDLKPDNIVLDEEHNAYLTDFGIAKEFAHDNLVSSSGFLVGTPAYLSPEQIKGHPITPRTDIYSLGIMLYELLVGKQPFVGQTPIELINKQLYETLPSIRVNQPHIPEAVNNVIQRATAKNPDQRFQDALSVSAALWQAIGFERRTPARAGAELEHEQTARPDVAILSTPHPATPSSDLPDSKTYTPADAAVTSDENPYKGLRAFQEAEADDFFGRTAQIDRLLGRLGEYAGSNPTRAARSLAIVGPSGSGKSSLVRAGLIPAIRNGGLSGSENWFIVQMVPGTDPMEELEAGLLRVSTQRPTNLLDQLKTDERGLHRAIKQMLPDDSRVELVLVIDQFEEVFTLVPSEAARVHFLDSLCVAVLESTSRIHLILTLRADFYDRPLLYQGFGGLIQERTEVVLPLSNDELQEAIVGPAQKSGLLLEPGLITALISDVSGQPGALPLLQYALTDLYDHRQGNRLTLTAYQHSGGVQGALANRAEELYQELDEPSRAFARQMFLRLIVPGESSNDSRQRALRPNLRSLAERQDIADNVLDRFTRFRLLTVDNDPLTRLPTVEIAHEALIRTWQRLREWVDEARDELRLQQRLAAAAGEWTAAERDRSFLLVGARLDQFAEWSSQTNLTLNETERQFLQSSLDERAARFAQEQAQQSRELTLVSRARGRLRALVAVLLVATLGALLLSGLAFGQRQLALENEQHAVSNAVTATVAQGQAQLNAATAAANYTRSEGLRLAALANGILERRGGNSELAALLSVRALETTYSPEADAAAVQALSQVFTERRFSGQTNSVNAVAFSPDGKTLATAAGDGTTRLWDVTSGTVLRTFSAGSTAKTVLSSVAFAPDGKSILTGSKDKLARLWSVESGQLLQTFTGHTDGVSAVAFSPDGKLIVTGSADNTARLWDTATGGAVRTLTGHTGAVMAVAFSPDGKLIVTGSLDQTARVWDTATGSVVRTLTGHTGAVTAVVFSPDGKLILTGSADNTARLWDAATGAPVLTYSGHTDMVASVSFSPNGQMALTGSHDQTAQLWDIKTGSLLRVYTGHLSWVTGVAFAPDGSAIATASDDDTARLWDARTWVSPQMLSAASAPIWRAVFTPDSKFVLAVGEDMLAHLWDVTRGIEVQTFKGHDDTITDAAFSPDGKTLLTGSYDKTARLWDVGTGSSILILQGHSDYVLAVAYSRDGKYVLTGSADKTARLWDTRTGNVIRTLSGHKDAVTSVAFSPDGSYILTGSADKTARLWNAQTGAEVRRFDGHQAGLTAVAFSPDGNYILTGSNDKTARLWDTQTGREIRRFDGHTDTVTAVSFSPDGKFVLTASFDKTGRVWDAQSGTEIRRLTGHSAAVSSISMSADGRFILTGSFDKSIRLWNTQLSDWMRFICVHLFRDFTQNERNQYNLSDQQSTCPVLN